MTIEHKDIPDGQIHEPKGISGASNGQVYTSNGSGSGTWTTPKLTGQSASLASQIPVSNGSGEVQWLYPPLGWEVHAHAGPSQTFASTFTKLTIDGLGATTNTDYAPPEIRGSSQKLWNNTTNRIEPMYLGDAYNVRLILPVTAESGTPSDIFITLDIGTNNSTPTTTIVEQYSIAGKTTPYQVVAAFPIFCLNTFKANGGQFFVKTNAGSITIANPSLFIVRDFGGEVVA